MITLKTGSLYHVIIEIITRYRRAPGVAIVGNFGCGLGTHQGLATLGDAFNLKGPGGGFWSIDSGEPTQKNRTLVPSRIFFGPAGPNPIRKTPP